MTTAAGVTYTYDGDGKRVQKSTGKLYWYGAGSEVLAESDAAGNLTDEYIFFGEKRIARWKAATNEINYYFADHLGSSRVVTSAAGTILDDSDFYPFGGERPVLSAIGNTYKFTGKERDAESGLDDFGARYYSSQYGRFMSADEPFAGWDQHNPQSFNLYSYVQNNPTNTTDPDGHDVMVCIASALKPICFVLNDAQYALLVKAQSGRQGITMPGGRFPRGDIKCGDQTCGTVRYFEHYEPENENPVSNALEMAFFAEGVRGIAALGRLAYRGITRLFASDATE